MKIDVRGEICPYPLKKTLEALERLAPGEELEVLTDHPPSLDPDHGESARVCDTR
jgi:tRNA 2-thiouridine synthesizing protein A